MFLIYPNWSAPQNVNAVFTTRLDGVSDPPYHSLNLSPHVGDDKDAVDENRIRLYESLPVKPHWLRQAHTCRVLRAEKIAADISVADAAYTFATDTICAVTTADCLPVLLCTADGSGMAAAHAGWRGLANGILENIVAALRTNSKQPLIAWLGPAISVAHFEVGADVYTALCRNKEDEVHFHLHPDIKNKWCVDLPQLAAQRLRNVNVDNITLSSACTYKDKKHFFSARRDHITGRMAALIWKSAPAAD